jgi:peptidyl-prolyl cis-trans isomerase B (cyclophilin B)
VLRALAVLLAALALALAACGDDDDDGDSGASSDAPAETQAQTEGPECADVEAPEPKPDGGQQKPKGKLDAGTSYEVTLETNCGAFTFRLDQKTAPNTAASLAALVRKGFYDGLTFHRIVPGFVIQGGDPTGTGTGGAGYTTRDAPPGDARYVRGVVAMAKGGNEPAGAGSSQFFVVTGADAGLPPDYALVGEVTSGIEVVELIGQQGDPTTEQPLRTVVIEKATLEEK